MRANPLSKWEIRILGLSLLIVLASVVELLVFKAQTPSRTPASQTLASEQAKGTYQGALVSAASQSGVSTLFLSCSTKGLISPFCRRGDQPHHYICSFQTSAQQIQLQGTTCHSERKTSVSLVNTTTKSPVLILEDKTQKAYSSELIGTLGPQTPSVHMALEFTTMKTKGRSPSSTTSPTQSAPIQDEKIYVELVVTKISTEK